MPPRMSLSPHDPAPASPRAPSPSSGLSHFLSKSSKWFSRSASASKVAAASTEPRSSTSSTRKHKISRPTDPRPILDGYAAGGSRSVLDLRGGLPPSVPSSPTAPSMGDLRNVSRRAWSRSADDLSQMSSSSTGFINPTFQDKVQQYRARSGSSASMARPTTPLSILSSQPSAGHASPNARHPFPTIQTTNLPSIPPVPVSASPSSTTSSLPTVSITADEASNSAVHTRSHSFTPKLSSKLASQRFMPSSPKRKGSAASERELDAHSSQDARLPPSPRTAFHFGLAAKSSAAELGSASHGHVGHAPSPLAVVGSSLLAPPPAIIEPGGGHHHHHQHHHHHNRKEEQHQDENQDDAVGYKDQKRASQIMYYSGFINRLADNQHQYVNLSSAKGWKPFKMELKGSKLYFYKPPHDRAASVKELFPTEIVPASGEPDEEEAEAEFLLVSSPNEDNPARREGLGTIGRKKRVFWGRRTHPELVRGLEGVEKGSYEALVHETVFATTFEVVPVVIQEGEENEEENEEKEGVLQEDQQQQHHHTRSQPWRDFASSVILCLPILIGRPKFESEFLRCCSYLVSGAADDSSKSDAQTHVTWLAMEYLRYHGSPLDSTAWEEWKTETLPGVSLSLSVLEGNWDLGGMGIPTSASMQALYVPTPMMGPGSPRFGGPGGMFSPRPEDGVNLVSLVQALEGLKIQGVPGSGAGGSGSGAGAAVAVAVAPRVPWAALEKEGLSRDVLLASDPRVVAQSLTLYHRTVLEHAPDNVTAASILSPGDSGESEFDVPSLRPLFGTEEQPHWLTKLVLLQVLGSDTSTGLVSAAVCASSSSIPTPISPTGCPRRSEDRNPTSSQSHPQPPSRPHVPSRSDVISAWIRIGELCRQAGDECSWRAILSALCSRPVARLDKVWRRVDLQALGLVEGWVHPPEAEGETTTTTVQVGEPSSTPWGGDVKIRLKEELDRARVEGSSASTEEAFRVETMDRARIIFERFRTSFLLCPRKTFVVDGELDQDVRWMVGFWCTLANDGGGVGGFAAKLQRVEQFMSLSLAAEPRRRGLFEPFYWAPKSSASQAPGQLLFPVLFPEPLPSLHLLDRTQLVRGRVDSDASEVFNIRASPDHQRSGSNATQQQQQPQRNRTLLSQQGTVIPVYNGELLLVVQKGPAESTPNSRPTSYATSRHSSSIDDASVVPEKTVSRNPSIRVKPGSSQGLERKASMAKRSSLPSLSHRPNFVITEPSTNPPLRVVVRAGTLPVLVKILVQGLLGVSVSVADDNGEMSLREGISRELVLDRNEFAKVWWNVFRSFVTPLAFFEALRKIYVGCQTPSSSPSVGDYLHVANQRGQVLGTIQEWLASGGGAQDVLDDAQLYTAIRAFLDSMTDHAVLESSHFSDPMVHQAWDALRRTRRTLESFFVSQTMRPRMVKGSLGQHIRVGTRSKQQGQQGPQQQTSQTAREREPPDVDRTNPEEFVDSLDGMAAAVFSNITEEDLYVLADLLEVQTADKTGWFWHKEVGTVDDVVEIQTMYTHVQDVEPSPLIPELGHESLYRLLPTSVRGCIRAYSLLRKWLISKLVSPRLGVRGRQTRMEFLLQVIEVARLRNMERVEPGQVAVQPCVRSFVEAVVSSALISVESRIHQRAWQCVAVNRGVMHDSLVSFLSRPFNERATSGHELTVDVGWLIERMLEVIVAPDVVDSTVSEGQTLVNFDKRRQLHNLVSQSHWSPLIQRHGQLEDTNRRGFERLSLVEKEVLHIQFDVRGIKEEATREAMHASAGVNQSAKKAGKPFNKLVTYQMEKNRRDKNLRARLQKEKLYEQARFEKREDVFNKALRSRKPVPVVQKQHRNKKSMSAFLNFMRPLSSAFGTDAFQTPGLKRTASELDFKTTGKPAQVLSLMDARVAPFANNERSYTFKLDTEDGGHYILQAMSKRELGKWLETISRVARSATKRRLTYLGNSPKPMLSDHLHVEPVSASRDPTAVFGVELEVLLQREAGGGVVSPGTVPHVIDECLSQVESRGLSEVGIYRIAGAATEINALKDAFNRGESPIRPETDIHAVCDLVKSWFRVLPEPVFPPSSYHEIMQKMQLERLEDRLTAIRNIVQKLPQANFNLLRRVSEHLDKVTDYEEQNQMTAEALAIVFSPNLLRAPQNDFVMILANMGHTHKLVKALITHYHVIFDAEAEAHSEDEYEAPIPEEDEEEEAEDDAGDEFRARTSEDERHATDNDS